MGRVFLGVGGWWEKLVCRQRVGVGLHALVVVVLVVVYVVWAPAPVWGNGVWLGALVAIVVVADLNEVWLATGIRLDATSAVVLLVLVVSGPLAAVLVSCVQLGVEGLVNRERSVVRAGTLANVAAFGCDILAGSAVLSLISSDPLGLAAAPTVFVAGLAMAGVNYLVGPLLYGTLQLGQTPGVMLENLRGALPAVLAVSALAATTAVLLAPLGVLALALFALITVIPQSVLAASARARPVSELTQLAATRLYAAALCDTLKIARRDRRVIHHAAQLAHDRSSRPNHKPFDAFSDILTDSSDASLTAWHATEAWNGQGTPAGISGSLIPHTSRILAVAQTWSALTAQHTPQMPHQHALLALQAHSETLLDPTIVTAAHTIIQNEHAISTHPTTRPALHTLPLPHTLRHHTLPKLLNKLPLSQT